jgi:hypothetical protein
MRPAATTDQAPIATVAAGIPAQAGPKPVPRSWVYNAAMIILVNNPATSRAKVATQIQASFPNRPFRYDRTDREAVLNLIQKLKIHHEKDGQLFKENNEHVPFPNIKPLWGRKNNTVRLHDGRNRARPTTPPPYMLAAKAASLQPQNYLTMKYLLENPDKFPSDLRPGLEQLLGRPLNAKQAESLIHWAQQLIIERKPYLTANGDMRDEGKKNFTVNEMDRCKEALVLALIANSPQIANESVVANHFSLSLPQGNEALHQVLGDDSKLPPVAKLIREQKPAAVARIMETRRLAAENAAVVMPRPTTHVPNR